MVTISGWGPNLRYTQKWLQRRGYPACVPARVPTHRATFQISAILGPIACVPNRTPNIWGFPKIRGTILGVPIIRTTYSIWRSKLGFPYFGKLPYTLTHTQGTLYAITLRVERKSSIKAIARSYKGVSSRPQQQPARTPKEPEVPS